jgi:hypothetical protein
MAKAKTVTAKHVRAGKKSNAALLLESLKAHTRYRDDAGSPVPGVTTITSQLDKPALIYWAWNLGMQQIDYRKARDQEANVGTIMHIMAECHFRGWEFDGYDEFPKVQTDRAKVAFQAFLDWDKTVGPQETIVVNGKPALEWEMVSKFYGYGGKLDRVFRRLSDGKIILQDFKTSSGIFDEMIYQVSAYDRLWNEVNTAFPIDEVHLLRLGKDDGAFEDHIVPEDRIVNGFEIFLHLLEVYNLRRKYGK